MVLYTNLNGNSNICAYEIGHDFIDVKFNGGDVYRYSYVSAGVANIEKMKILARMGSGLNSYIMHYCRKLYETKYREADDLHIQFQNTIYKIFKTYLPEIVLVDSYGDNEWFEQKYSFDININSYKITLGIFVRFDYFSNNITRGVMGFNCPYKKEIWEKNKLTSTMLFTVREDISDSDRIAFIYNDVCESDKDLKFIHQFAADLEYNFAGPYLVYIGQLNGLL